MRMSGDNMGKKILKTAAWIVAGIAALIILIIIYGAMLPAEHNFMRSVQLAQPPDTVYQTILDFGAHTAWRPDVAKFERVADSGGKETWRVTDQHGVTMRMAVEDAIPTRRIVLHFVDEKGVADVTWEFSVGAIPGGSLVSVRERGRIKGAFFRGMNKLFGGARYAEDLLRNLARKFGQEAVIQ
jgi:uncharacterized protein YndB with AHSA1/START domain